MKYVFMLIGAVIGALGGAATGAEIPEHFEKVKANLPKKKKEDEAK